MEIKMRASNYSILIKKKKKRQKDFITKKRKSCTWVHVGVRMSQQISVTLKIDKKPISRAYQFRTC